VKISFGLILESAEVSRMQHVVCNKLSGHCLADVPSGQAR